MKRSTSSSVSIVIPTHNRCEILRKTLLQLRKIGVNEASIVIYVNGSYDSTESMIRIEYPLISVLVSSKNVGACVARNEAIRHCQTEFIFGLDDDSWPIEPNFMQIVEAAFLEFPHAGFLAGCICDKKYPTGAINRQITSYAVQSFVGCGFATRKSCFLEMEGFRDFFLYYHEEPEISLRAYARGWQTIFVPSLRVFHDCSEVNRDRRFTTRLGLCNNFSSTVLNEPVWLCLIHLLILTIKGIRFAFQQKYWGIVLLAWKDFVVRFPKLIKARYPLTSKKFLEWRYLRHCPPD